MTVNISPPRDPSLAQAPGNAGTGDGASAERDLHVYADLAQLSPRQADAVVRLMEAAPAVRRRYQFFVWSQNQLHPLLQHQVLVCAAYARQRKALVFDVFHSIVLAPALLAALTNSAGALLRAVTSAWIEGHGRPLRLDLNRLLGPELLQATSAADVRGIDSLLVHGVSRPQRPAEIESLFIFFGAPDDVGTERAARHAELLLPHLHSTWQRVCATEAEAPQPGSQRALPARRGEVQTRPVITDRECQILMWVRDGKSNLQIGEVLGISPLTVKNHVQKILRKLGAANRAQAVALAMQAGLLDAAHP
jgi:transcriptional regulator EpsA